MTSPPALRALRAFRAALRALGALGAALLCQVALVAPVHAAFEFVAPRWDAATTLLDVARSELGQERVVLGAQLDWSKLQPADGVLLLHPEAAPSFAEARAFLNGGGRLALADDFGRGDELLSRFHISRVGPPAGTEHHAGNPNLPVATPTVEPAAYGALRHPIVRNVESVVTNHAQALVPESSIELTPVLEFDGTKARLPFALTGVIGDAKACGLGAVASVPRKGARCGRLFAMGDPSVFIDLMMQFDGNRELARGLVRYLVEDDVWGARGGRLYVLANRFEEHGHFNDGNGMRRAVDRMLSSADKWLQNTRAQGLSKRWSTALAIGLGGLVVLWSFRTSGQVYQRPTPRYAASAPLVAQGGVPGMAAVLSADTTSTALVVAELKGAAESYLRAHLHLEYNAPTRTILDTIAARGALDARSQRQLLSQFEIMTAAEEALLGRTPPGVRLDEKAIHTIHQALEELLPKVSGTKP